MHFQFLMIDLAAMANRYNHNEQTVILQAIDDPIVADAKTQMAFLAASERLDSVRPGIL